MLECHTSFYKNMLSIRNTAIIAHVDHGKTTLIDSMLKQSGIFRGNQEFENRIMDSNDLERERGITITSKCTSITLKNVKYNIIDTPGHSDFGGEVERILSIVDGAVLLVDSSEGVMPQTKFVLSKALSTNIKIIVVINKVDKPNNRANEVLDEVFDLFCALNATEEQLNFPVLYAVGREGWVSEENSIGKNLNPLFEIIKNYIPDARNNKLLPFTMLASLLDVDPYLGRVLIGKVYSGSAKVGDTVKSIDLEGKVLEITRLTKLFSFEGIKKVPIKVVESGDIVAITGMEKTSVSNTICNYIVNKPIKSSPIDPPTMTINIKSNDSPFSGIDGSKITSRAILDRLKKEIEHNIAINLKILENGDTFEIGGRGELQLSILIENMRREGFELSISKPEIVFKNDINGKILEPIEEVVIDVDTTYNGTIINNLLLRKASLKEVKSFNNERSRLIFHIPSRTLIGYQNKFNNDTRGNGILNRSFNSYQEYKGDSKNKRNGVLISNINGEAASYALSNLESRGTLFIPPKTKVYKGMIIGEHNRSNDLEVNPVKSKKMTNMRASGNDENIKLIPHKKLVLENILPYIKDDELIEITPKNIRLRKILLCSNKRKISKYK